MNGNNFKKHGIKPTGQGKEDDLQKLMSEYHKQIKEADDQYKLLSNTVNAYSRIYDDHQKVVQSFKQRHVEKVNTLKRNQEAENKGIDLELKKSEENIKDRLIEMQIEHGKEKAMLDQTIKNLISKRNFFLKAILPLFAFIYIIFLVIAIKQDGYFSNAFSIGATLAAFMLLACTFFFRWLVKRMSPVFPEKARIEVEFEKRITEFHEKESAEIEIRFREKRQALIKKHKEDLNSADDFYLEKEKQLKLEYQKKLKDLKQTFDDLSRHLNSQFATADDETDKWKDPKSQGPCYAIPYLRLGSITHTVQDSPPQQIAFPVIASFLTASNIMLSYHRGRKNDMKLMLFDMICRVLMSYGGGNIILTLVDPVGLGANFSPFLKLEEQIYGSKVWTESQHIENQLKFLARHIENVIQKYLRNDYDSISMYHFGANRIDEAYRLLVVVDFPDAFSEEAAHRLKTIMQNGSKAGVHTLIVTESEKATPYGFEISDFENLAHAIHLAEHEDRLNLDYMKPLGKKRLKLSTLGNLDTIVQVANEDFNKKETLKIPIGENLVPQADWWKIDSGKSISVPIGKQGARRTQVFEFNNESAPHGLLVGMSGSGKSNLLHVLILNSMMKYSPNQLELHLIDFKGGVEFNIYAEREVPHLRTIAIESDREFGLSIIENIEQELLTRETLFRDKNVERLDRYHKQYPEENCPRILLIIDEFQEFFSEEDSIKAKAEIILDRIARKGRALGINMLLASQSLSGYSLPRHTKDLIAVRIALMCSENDSRLLLAEDNPEAKLLARPGEGIYNAKNGLIEGNDFFQTYFSSREEVSTILNKIEDHMRKSGFTKDQRMVVFKGSADSHLESNMLLTQLVPVQRPRQVYAWVGEPMRIGDDVCAKFSKQSGSNLLVVGIDEVSTIHVMTSALLSVCAHYLKNTAEFYILNFLNLESENYNKLKEYLGILPFKIVFGKSKNTKEYLDSIREEVEMRLQTDTSVQNSIYFVIVALQRARLFRKDGYAMSPEGEQLSYILREGPDVGVHTLLHVDTVGNFERCFESGILREFSQRVAFQMSSDDSMSVIDTNSAAKLGRNRGYYYDEIDGLLNKFRPYIFPNLAWAEQVIANKIDEEKNFDPSMLENSGA